MSVSRGEAGTCSHPYQQTPRRSMHQSTFDYYGILLCLDCTLNHCMYAPGVVAGQGAGFWWGGHVFQLLPSTMEPSFEWLLCDF
jgi:hypothetical protein